MKHKSLRTSQTHTPQKQSTKRKLSNVDSESFGKQSIKQSYFSLVQHIFTEQVLQNKRVIAKNSKIKYFFGAIFHGLKQGIIKPSLSDFMMNANKLFKEAKIPQLKEILKEYKTLQNTKIQEVESKENQESIPTKEKQVFLIKKSVDLPLHTVKTNYEPLRQITKQNYQMQNRRSFIIQQKQKALQRLGNVSNYDCFQSNYKKQNFKTLNNIHKTSRQSYVVQLTNPRSSFDRMNTFQRQQNVTSFRSSRRPSEAFNVQDDNKLNELNNKLEYFIGLNQEHIKKSQSVRKHCQ